MDNIYSKFIDKKPSCFQEFNLENSDDLKTGWDPSTEFVSKLIRCVCGTANLNIYSSSNEGTLLAPIEVECPSCGYRAEIFHPEQHGWDGENGDNCSLFGDKPVEKTNDVPVKVIAEYSYQGAENYADLMNEGITNPEDYFDIFSIYAIDQSGSPIEVVSYECA